MSKNIELKQAKLLLTHQHQENEKLDEDLKTKYSEKGRRNKKKSQSSKYDKLKETIKQQIEQNKKQARKVTELQMQILKVHMNQKQV